MFGFGQGREVLTMTGLRFIHAADLHLGSPLAALSSRIDIDKAEHLVGLAATSFDNLVNLAVDRAAEFVVVAGDVYDSAEREVSAQLRFHRGLTKLHDSGIRTFIVHGNHDPLQSSFTPARKLPDSVTVFTSSEVGVEQFVLGDGSSTAVAGISYQNVMEQRNLALGFSDIDVPPEVAVVGLLHTNVGGSPGHGRYAPCTVEDLVAAPVHYWALGHVHERSVQRLGHGRWWAYSGNLQGRSSRRTEGGAKGALVVPIGGGSVGEPEFAACDAIRFETRAVSPVDVTDLGEVLDLIRSEATDVTLNADGRPVLLHIDLAGPCPIHLELVANSDRLVDLARSELADIMGDGDLVRVRNQTRPAESREQLLARKDLLGALLTHLDSIDRSRDSFERLLSIADVDADISSLVLHSIDAVPQGDVDQIDGASEQQALSVGSAAQPLERLWDRIEQNLVDQLIDGP